MNIYFTASTVVQTDLTENYKKILSLLNGKNHIISGKQIVTPSKLLKDKKLGSKKIFERERKLIKKADVVVAEVTRPSMGVGGSIVYALLQDKPVVALCYEDAEDKISPMIAGNPSEDMYLEHYTDDNLQMVLSRTLSHIKLQLSKKGKLIVIDGGDGSGKETQSKLLKKALEKKGEKVKYIAFPRYYSSFHGKFVGRYLAGEFGDVSDVSPYLISLAYAIDRASARDEIVAFLEKGGIVIADRYVTSSMAHLSANLPEKERDKFIAWLDELEYKHHKMPRPDIVLYLYVPWQISEKLIEKSKSSRKYSGGKADIHERNKIYKKETEKQFLKFIRYKKKWKKVDCLANGKLKSIKQVHQLVINAVGAIL